MSEQEKGTDKDKFISDLCERYKTADKSTFYPFVHSLFMAMGVDCHGEVGRIDGLFEYKGIKIPAEIKSFTETAAYNMKGARQAMENKIIVSKEVAELEYASLLVGYYHPKSTSEIQEFIDAVHQELGIKIIAFDIRTLVTMCVNVIWEKQKIDFDKMLLQYGIAEV